MIAGEAWDLTWDDGTHSPAASPIADTKLDTLRARLTDAADREGLLDVAYRTLDTPVGPVLVAATERGLVRVAYLTDGPDEILGQLASAISPRVLAAPKRLDRTASEIDEYFAGRRRTFDLPLDLRLAKGFRLEVITRLPDIGYGSTASYAQVATAAGSPKAVRAVGTACALNPLVIVLPCHRVVRSDGSMGGYAGGPEAKQTLLTLESTR